MEYYVEMLDNLQPIFHALEMAVTNIDQVKKYVNEIFDKLLKKFI
jgi:hypothetical protein